MTPTDDLAQMGQGMVYFRPVAVSDLPAEMQSQAQGREVVTSVYNHAGKQIALVASARLASHLARENNMCPVALH